MPGTNTVGLVERPEPSIGAPDEATMRGGRSRAPVDHTELVVGHEMFGRIVEAGTT